MQSASLTLKYARNVRVQPWTCRPSGRPPTGARGFRPADFQSSTSAAPKTPRLMVSSVGEGTSHVCCPGSMRLGMHDLRPHKGTRKKGKKQQPKEWRKHAWPEISWNNDSKKSTPFLSSYILYRFIPVQNWGQDMRDSLKHRQALCGHPAYTQKTIDNLHCKMKCCTYSSILTRFLKVCFLSLAPRFLLDQAGAKLPAKSQARGLTLETLEPRWKHPSAYPCTNRA